MMPNTINRETQQARVTNNGPRNRQAQYKARMYADGFVQVTGWVNSHQAADAILYLKLLRINPSLVPGPLRNPESGKLVSRSVAELGEDFDE